MSQKLSVSIRMYRVGELGDCFYLQFKEGQTQSRVLIDCGSFRNSTASKERLQKIASHITEELNGEKIDVVVGTHQHNDHLSGFVHAKEIFEGNIDQVWLSWLDDPKDAAARKINKEHKKIVLGLLEVVSESKKIGKSKQLNIATELLDFYGLLGAAPAVPAEGIKVLKEIGTKPVKYLEPGDRLILPNLNKNSVNVYVLGPPRNPDLLYDISASSKESYDHRLQLAEAGTKQLLSAVKNKIKGIDQPEESDFPFNKTYKRITREIDPKVRQLYNNDPSRQIEDDWLEQANRLAIYMDTYTNNSSLVLAFELVQSGKVLLFVGDAQTGNWLSWKEIKWKGKNAKFSINQLLENTVLYKVGHHGSHNASLVEAIEKMCHPELVAMIPVDRTDGHITKQNGWRMPAKNLLNKLKEKTNNRVMVMDKNGFEDDCQPTKGKGKSGWKMVEGKPKVDNTNNYVEYTIYT
ncbi:hypothetical protein KJS94_12520 [Flavihumibacter rivuli]|uniref:MBL fold metallo-hydrolase n=1 Tax=Flavihumibacter rivuli TaxID=2838156 RepID=UPI001BDF41BE|nr:MBL fold metallo-hydrolase [Flavihumibacter rivuli]ULQ55467.1 hypothetical protein KJS94_12520 [Flavihumibacter rivuli]